MSIQRWLREPTTVVGIGLAVGTTAGAAAHALGGDTSWSVASGSVVAALVHMALPDNTSAPGAAAVLAEDVVSAVVGGKAPSPAALAVDLAKVADAVASSAAPSAPRPEARP